MATLFSRIIKGEIPSYKCAEDDSFYAFLDINPVKQGHTLVVPKHEVDYYFDLSDDEIAEYMHQMGFELKNPRNWTWATPEIYLSDMHDENVLRSNRTNTLFVVDCDIRINTPGLRQGGTRQLTTEVSF